ncbi:hypothetical protein G7047_13470 [Diaphorobacter sp. HDW4A]|uniref:BRCT domain-containing protein n=1 Tax=Diaphorobacter sp. HDW4A TaxID=2714924 RepID=UPI00140D190E|nr:BRCT domain-containing protein [Diaphorobacter sp. HDW4A]QIL78483.1 hypothetical protein G7047_00015 [Diaphorobacter sp. HDW4A]QIL80801.1 hypothetical protein G7047_13470 [Diaphorobacter sp. HDW4A]
METLEFLYKNSDGETKLRKVINWAEEGHYIVGNDLESNGAPRTFRKDRITEYLNGSASALKEPHSGPPPKLIKAAPEAQRPNILFTGFASALRAQLETDSTAAGLKVVKTVTQNLAFVCAGPNAGPTKVAKARVQGSFIVGPDDLPELLESGVLPDRIFD